MNKGELPSPSGRRSTPFLIGKNSCGNWVVQDPSGLHNGLFVDRVQALKHAMFENGGRPRAVLMLPQILGLDMSAKPGVGEHSSGNGHTESKQVA